MFQDFPEKNVEMTARENVNLKTYNTLGVTATAKTFYEISNPAQLTQLHNDEFFWSTSPVILGGGSNVLIKKDLSRPVLKVSIPGISVVREDESRVFVQAGAGVNWHEMVRWCVERGFGNIENLALIPGTVGAAPIQNIGAYGVELKDVFYSLDAFMMESGKLKSFSPEECRFGYRDSIFKNELKGKAVVTGVTLQLKKPPHSPELSYYALQDYFKNKQVENPGIKDVFDAVIEIRQSKLPDPALIGNAGSFFKNPIVDDHVYSRIAAKYPSVPSFPAGNGMIKIPAGWLIEQAGWKGKKVGNVGTYKNQALVIVNHGGATGEEIFNHALRIKNSVKKIFGIELDPEVNVVE